MKYYLGIDNGGTVTKAALYTAAGSEIAVASEETRFFSPKPGFTERDLEEMERTVCSVIRNVVSRSTVIAGDIAGIAVCGHGKGLYLVGENGKPVRPGILSGDNRAWMYPEQWNKQGIADKVYEKTFQRIVASQPVSLLAWLRDNEPAACRSVRWIFECKDYVRFLLTGEAYAELSDYSGANLVNLNTRSYDKELLDLFGLGMFFDKLPPLKRATDRCGSVSGKVAALTGLAEGTPVFGGMFDIDACAVASAVTDPGDMCMVAGTWSINEYVSNSPVADGSVMMNSIFCDGIRYLVEESSATSAVNLEWYIKYMLPDIVAESEKRGTSPYAVTDSWIEALPGTETYPFFFPFVMASNVHPNARSCFIGISYCHSRQHLTKSVYEGVVFSHRYHMERLLKSRKQPFSCIRFTGGVSNSPVWLQMFADILQKNIIVTSAKETGCLGCAMNVAVALGDYRDFSQAASNMVKTVKKIRPDPRMKAFYDRRYALYIKLLDSLDSVWNDFI